MSSLFDDTDEKTLVGADFVAEVTGELRRAFDACSAKLGLTQTEVANRLGVSKSAVHRWLRGDANMTLRTLGEICWAIDHVANVELHPINEALSATNLPARFPTLMASSDLQALGLSVIGLDVEQHRHMKLLAVDVKMPSNQASSAANDQMNWKHAPVISRQSKVAEVA